MKKKDFEDFYSGKNEVELSDELIEQLVKDKKWPDIESLKEFLLNYKWYDLFN